MSEIDEREPVTIANMTRHINDGWGELQAFIATLTPAQMTEPTDAAGWTVKDHLIHLVVWQDGITALLKREPRLVAMGVGEATWKHGHDAVNALIQTQHRAMPLADVLATLERSRNSLIMTLATMRDDDLMLPYEHFDAAQTREYPIFAYIVGNSFEHYREHIPWMQAIADTV
jgi:uncharacterized protein (TIGR03083 family)